MKKGRRFQSIYGKKQAAKRGLPLSKTQKVGLSLLIEQVGIYRIGEKSKNCQILEFSRKFANFHLTLSAICLNYIQVWGKVGK
jgi:hypothetical protein